MPRIWYDVVTCGQGWVIVVGCGRQSTAFTDRGAAFKVASTMAQRLRMFGIRIVLRLDQPQ